MQLLLFFFSNCENRNVVGKFIVACLDNLLLEIHREICGFEMFSMYNDKIEQILVFKESIY